jgi:hypothetical protein
LENRWRNFSPFYVKAKMSEIDISGLGDEKKDKKEFDGNLN